MHHASRPDGLRLQHLKSNTFKVTFRIGDRRYRFADGRPLGLPLRPNRVSPRQRQEATELLLAFKQALDKGWRAAPVKSASVSLVFDAADILPVLFVIVVDKDIINRPSDLKVLCVCND